MALFTEEIEVYALLGKLFEELVKDEEAVAQLRKANVVVQYQFRNPESTITLKLPAEGDVDVQFGPTTWRPEVVYAMDADIAHRYFLGQINPTIALARNEIRASGPVAKILDLIPTAKVIVPRYEAQLTAAGRLDLITPGAEAVEPEPVAEGDAEESPAGEVDAAAPDAPEADAPQGDASEAEADTAEAEPAPVEGAPAPTAAA